MNTSSFATSLVIAVSCAAVLLPTATAGANEPDAVRMQALQKVALESPPAERTDATAPVPAPFKAVTLQPASGLHSPARGLLPVGDWRRLFPLKPGERSAAGK